jgi:purine-nucleoside phosphorylase
MYKHLNSDDYKKFLDLPSDYRVDGMLCYGTWARAKQVDIFKNTLEKLGKAYEYGSLKGFLEQIVEFNVEGKRYWFDVSYGGALLSEYLHLACLFGSKKNILLGTCGGLSPEVPGLSIIFPAFSFGNESATRMYDPTASDHKHYSDATLTTSLKKRFSARYKSWDGGTTTCQAMMAETLEDVQRWSAEGYLAVEMEAATVFSVSKHFGVPAAAILLVADNLIKGETVASEDFQKNSLIRAEIRNEQYKVALEELLN